MKKLLFVLSIVGLFAVNSFGQMSTLWERNATQGSKPTWMGTGSTERGIAYGYVGSNHRLYVPSRNGGTFVYVLDANTGADILDGGNPKSLNTTGISGGLFVIQDAEVSEDGIIFVCNLTTDASTSPFKVYRWDSESALPSLAITYTSPALLRLGDKFTITGKVSDNTAIIWVSSGTNTAGNQKIFKWTMSGGAFVGPTEIPLSDASVGGNASIGPLPDGSFYYNYAGINPKKYASDGTFLGLVSGSTISTGSTSIRFLKNTGGDDYFVTYSYGTGTNDERGNLVKVIGGTPINNASNEVIYGRTEKQGATSSIGNSDIAFRDNGDGSYTIFPLGTNLGLGAYRTTNSPLKSPMAVDGNMNEDRYRLLAVRTGGTPWAPMQLDSIVYYPDQYNQILYVGVGGVLQDGSTNGFGIWLDVTGENGSPLGTSLGGSPGGQYMSGNGGANTNFKADFEVDYMFAMNAGGAGSPCHVDAVSLLGGRTAEYLGNCGLVGTPAVNLGGVFTAGTVQFAFDNAGGNGQGFEIAIPFSELGSSVTEDDSINVFSFIVSATAWFCSATIPGNLVADPGHDADFSTMANGPFNTKGAGSTAPLPVELKTFSASATVNRVNLSWETASEYNNYGFEIQRAGTDKNWAKIGFVDGAGNSNTVKKYSYTDKEVYTAGQYYYRLKQIDNDGTFSYSNVLSVNIEVPKEYALNQNYPNPFNPSTTIQFALPTSANVKLSVYDILGKEVAVVEQGQKEAGIYSVNFNASNLASGIYVYKLTANGTDGSKFTQTKKLVLMK
ncbi:MAG: DUF4623 domain-containing protein [Ignavibacteriales bacterium]|nr:DUF4623 domain-containing protein [Ignavibacteriales bacterium]